MSLGRKKPLRVTVTFVGEAQRLQTSLYHGCGQRKIRPHVPPWWAREPRLCSIALLWAGPDERYSSSLSLSLSLPQTPFLLPLPFPLPPLPTSLSSPFLSIQRATISTLPLLISAGAVLGKVNLVQLAVMVLVEAMTFGAIRVADKKVFRVSSWGCERDLGEGGR